MKEVIVEGFPGIRFIGRQDDSGHITVIPPAASRACGSCTACCTIMPVSEIRKPAHTRCTHLSVAAKRCRIYTNRPRSCEVWWCMWAVNPVMSGALRPDISHIVVDLEPERLVKIDEETGEEVAIPAIVAWVDPKFPDAHKAPAFRAALEKLCRTIDGPALIRFGSMDGIVLYPPRMLPDQPDEWVSVKSTTNPNLAPRAFPRRS